MFVWKKMNVHCYFEPLYSLSYIYVDSSRYRVPLVDLIHLGLASITYCNLLGCKKYETKNFIS